MNRRGIELSVNFLVGFVLAVVLFGLSTTLLYTMFNQGNQLNDVTQEKIDSMIGPLLCNAQQQICIAQNRLSKRPGDLAITGLYIYNIKGVPQTYTITVDSALATTPDKQEIVDAADHVHIYSRSQQITVPPNEQESAGIGILVEKSARKGTYVFDVYIQAQGSEPPQLRKIYITVV